MLQSSYVLCAGDKNMSSSQRDVTKQNLDIARNLLLIFELKEKLDEIPRIFGGPLSEIRDFLSDRADKIKVATLPLTLVFIASCLENYLRSIKPGVKYFKDLIKHYRRKLGDKLTKDAHEIRIKRNVILHHAGVVDKNAEKEFEEIGLTMYSEGSKLALNKDQIRGYISAIESICDLVK